QRLQLPGHRARSKVAGTLRVPSVFIISTARGACRLLSFAFSRGGFPADPCLVVRSHTPRTAKGPAAAAREMAIPRAVGGPMRPTLRTLVLIGALIMAGPMFGQAVKRLNEADLTRLIELQIGDDAIVNALGRSGVAFEVDEAAIERLRKAGAS